MNKVNAINPEIVVHGTLEKPYYEVEYYDVDNNAWTIGYSSYDLSIVCRYIRDYFNIIEQDVDFQPIIHGRWIRAEAKGYLVKRSSIWYCSECSEKIKYNDTLGRYHKTKKTVSQVNPRCRKCGAKMDGGAD